jgi:Uma2 family endonuclease
MVSPLRQIMPDKFSSFGRATLYRTLDDDSRCRARHDAAKWGGTTMARVKTVMTYRDYAALPDDGRRYELHDGDLSVTPSPGRTHQAIVGRLFAVLLEHVTTRGLGEVYVSPFDVILSDRSVVQPDIVFVAAERLAVLAERGVEGAPTLVVEIISPSTGRIDRVTKPALYARHRVPHCWIVDPAAHTLEAYVLSGTVYRLDAHWAGAAPHALAPFPDLLLEPARLWR